MLKYVSIFVCLGSLVAFSFAKSVFPTIGESQESMRRFPVRSGPVFISRLGLRGGLDTPHPSAKHAQSEEEEAKLLGLLQGNRSGLREAGAQDKENIGADSGDEEVQATKILLQKELPLLFKRPSMEFSEFTYLPEVFRYLTRSENHDTNIRVTTSQFGLKVCYIILFHNFEISSRALIPLTLRLRARGFFQSYVSWIFHRCSHLKSKIAR